MPATPATPTAYALTVAQLREQDRAASRQWDALTDARTCEYRRTLARNRALRRIGSLSVPQAPEPTGALAIAGDTRKRRAARAQLMDAKRRDAIERADTYPLAPLALMDRALSAVERATPSATDDERSDALSYCLYRVIAAHGPEPLSVDIAPRWLERLASGRVLNERTRAARFAQLAEDRATDDEHDQEHQQERRNIAGRNVWADMGAAALDADGGAGALRAVEVSADALADALQRVTRRAVHPSSRAALGAALNGYRSGAELAAALGLSPGTARKRLHDGRAKLRADYPTPDQLADALALAMSTLDSDRVRMTGPQRAALALVNRAHRVAYRDALTSCTGTLLPTAPIDSAPTVYGGTFRNDPTAALRVYGLTGNGQREQLRPSIAPIGTPIAGCHCEACSHRRTMNRR